MYCNVSETGGASVPARLFRRLTASVMLLLFSTLAYILREILLMRSSPAFAVAMWHSVPYQFECVLGGLAAYLAFAAFHERALASRSAER